MTKVAVLGSTGMLGTTMSEIMRDAGFHVTEFNRRSISHWRNRKASEFCVTSNTSAKDLQFLSSFDVVINSVGLIKQVITEEDKNCETEAHLVNSHFPSLLNDFTETHSIPVIQIGTDCVFSGETGRYGESANQSYTDLYSFTKCVGEELSLSTNILRTSVIGVEIGSNFSLLSWVLNNPKNSSISGFTNHIWNGVTALHFSRIAAGVIQNQSYVPGIRHVVPANLISKDQLVREIINNFDRTDISVIPKITDSNIDRTLVTDREEENLRLWKNAGYENPPTIQQMVYEYSAWFKKNRHNLVSS